MKKRTFYNELAYVFGILTLAFGTALMECTEFGMSMVVAPAYILHLKVSQYLPFFSFGMAEYTLQAVLIIAIIIIMRKVKFGYFFSFVTAVLYGLALDGAMWIVDLFPTPSFPIKVVYFALGMIINASAIAMFFRSYISPEAYELFVKELSDKFKININRFKIGYDVTSCIVSVIMSFLFFGFGTFKGVHVGTFVTAVLNGVLIGVFSKFYDKIFDFKDRLPFRKFFE